MKDIALKNYNGWEITANDSEGIEYQNKNTKSRSRHSIEVVDYKINDKRDPRYSIAIFGPQGMCKKHFRVNTQKEIIKKLKELMDKYN